MVVQSSDDALDVINTNNTDAHKTRNAVRLIIAHLDVVSLRIADAVEARLSDKALSRLGTIPILFTVDDSTIAALAAGLETPAVEQLRAALDLHVVCGFVPKDITSTEVLEIANGIVKRYAGIFSTYSDLRAAKKSFGYPRYKGEHEQYLSIDDSGNVTSDFNCNAAASGAARATTSASSNGNFLMSNAEAMLRVPPTPMAGVFTPSSRGRPSAVEIPTAKAGATTTTTTTTTTANTPQQQQQRSSFFSSENSSGSTSPQLTPGSADQTFFPANQQQGSTKPATTPNFASRRPSALLETLEEEKALTSSKALESKPLRRYSSFMDNSQSRLMLAMLSRGGGVGGLDGGAAVSGFDASSSLQSGPRPRVGLADDDNRPNLYCPESALARRGSIVPAKSPAGFVRANNKAFFEDEQRNQQYSPHQQGGGGGGDHEPDDADTPTPKPHVHVHVHKKVVIAPEMAPFVMRDRPPLSSSAPKSSHGLDRDKVQRLRSFARFKKASKVAITNSGSTRLATGAEQIKALDKAEVIRSAFGFADITASKKKSNINKALSGGSASASTVPTPIPTPAARDIAAARLQQGGKFSSMLQQKVNGTREEEGGKAGAPDHNKPATVDPVTAATATGATPTPTPGKKGWGLLRQKIVSEPTTSAADATATATGFPAPLSLAQIVVAAAVKAKETMTLSAILEAAKAAPADMLQYDLLEIKPSRTNNTIVQSFLKSGNQFQQQKDYKEARFYFDRAVKCDGKNVEALFCRGVANEKTGEFLKSLHDFSMCLMLISEKASEQKKTKTTLAPSSEKIDRPKSATTSRLSSAHNTGLPTSVDLSRHEVTICKVFTNRALVYIHMGDDESALADLTSALKTDNKDPVARGARAMVLRRTGDFVASQRDYLLINKHAAAFASQAQLEEAMLAEGFAEVRPESGKPAATAVAAVALYHQRPQTAPTSRPAPLNTADLSTYPKLKLANQTPLEAQAEANDPARKLRVQLEQSKLAAEKKERDSKREAKEARKGGDLSNIDVTPQPSPVKSLFKKQATFQASVSGEARKNDARSGFKKSADIPGSLSALVIEVEKEDKEVTLVDSDADDDEDDAGIIDDDDDDDDDDASNDSDKDLVKIMKRKEEVPEEQKIVADHELDNLVIGPDGINLFDKLFSVPTDVQRALTTEPRKRTMEHRRQIAKLLKEYEITHQFPEEQLLSMAAVVEYRTVAKGSYVSLQGELAEAAFICASGSISIKMKSTNEVVHNIGTIRTGEAFGEYALLMSGAKKSTPFFSSRIQGSQNDADGNNDSSLTGVGSLTHSLRGSSISSAAHSFDGDDVHLGMTAVPLRESYLCETPCELIMFVKTHFDEYLRDACLEKQKEKFRILKRSHIFKKWSTDALVRLSRFGRVITLPRSIKIVEQGTRCENIYFIMKGVCIAQKYPNRVAQLERKLLGLESQLRSQKLKYSYHRTLEQLSKTPEQINERMTKVGKHGMVAKGTVKIDGGQGVYIKPDHVTNGELRQLELDKQIKECNKLLMKVKKEESENPRLVSKDIEKLFAPSFFGAESLLDPDCGLAMGSIKTDTACVVLCVHKIMVQAFDITQGFLDDVAKRMVRYPDDLALDVDIRENENWEDYKSDRIMEINKKKWPVGKAYGTMLEERTGGRTIVVKDLETGH